LATFITPFSIKKIRIPINIEISDTSSDIKIALKRKIKACIKEDKKFQLATKALVDLSASLLTELTNPPTDLSEKKFHFEEKKLFIKFILNDVQIPLEINPT